MNEKIEEKIETLRPFTKFCMTIGQLPTSYVESMSYYEQLLWFTKYLQEQVIPTINQNAEAVEELQGLFIELQNYVNNYFDNLDVQEEINKKLDEMADDGSLTVLLKQYIDPLYTAYENEINDEMVLFKSNINRQIDEIEELVESATSGSPAGVYATVSDLTTADPDHSKIYLVLADGKWYYYSTSDTDWVAGGVYQSSSVSESDPIIESINNQIDKIEDMLVQKNLFENETCNGQVTSGGNVTTAEGNVRTDYNPCSAETTYTISWVAEDSFSTYVSYFTSEKIFISRQNTGTKQSSITVTTPENAAYFIPQWMGASLTDIANVQIELGEQKTPYEPPQFNVKTNRVVGLNDLINRVNTIEEGINSTVFVLPDYYEDEISDVMDEVLDNIDLNSVVFGLYTDIHFTSTSGSEYPANIREINAMRKLADKLPLYFTHDGGDIMTYSTYDFSVNTINKTMNTFSGCRVPHFVSKGDHDSAQTDTQITDTEFAALTYPYMPQIIRCPEALNNYYYDLPHLKTRFINLNSGTAMSGGGTTDLEKAYTWLLNDVFTDDVKNDWQFIIFGHAPFDYEWNVGMVERGTFGGVRQTQIMMIDLANAINTAGEFTKNAGSSYTKTFYKDSYGVLTQDTSATPETITMGSLGTSYHKDFTGWTSKVKLLVSGHCHCDRLNKVTNGISYDFGIAYTASAQVGGLKDESTYYYPCFGDEGKVAYWYDITDRSVGNITEALMDIYIITGDNIKKIRFGIGNNLELNL